MQTIDWKSQVKSGWFRLWVASVVIIFFIAYAEHGHPEDQSLPMFLLSPAVDLYHLYLDLTLHEVALILGTGRGDRPITWAVSVTCVYCIFSAIAFLSWTWVRRGFRKDDQRRPD